jgi:hypothetical protein
VKLSEFWDFERLAGVEHWNNIVGRKRGEWKVLISRLSYCALCGNTHILSTCILYCKGSFNT